MSAESAPDPSALRRRGRPRKFTRPARAVTLTLPEDVIAALHGIDPDPSRAIVRLVEPHLSAPPRPSAELAAFGSRAVILVPPNPQLGARTGVELVPLSDGRALIAFDDSISASQIELRVADAIGDPALAPDDRSLFEALLAILSEARRSETLVVRQQNIIVVQRVRRRSRGASGARVRAAKR
jgi:hypothetical protein